MSTIQKNSTENWSSVSKSKSFSNASGITCFQVTVRPCKGPGNRLWSMRSKEAEIWGLNETNNELTEGWSGCVLTLALTGGGQLSQSGGTVPPPADRWRPAQPIGMDRPASRWQVEAGSANQDVLSSHWLDPITISTPPYNWHLPLRAWTTCSFLYYTTIYVTKNPTFKENKIISTNKSSNISTP